MDDVSSITSAPLEEEDELLRRPERPESARVLEDAIEQLSSFRNTHSEQACSLALFTEEDPDSLTHWVSPHLTVSTPPHSA
ncbi:hypothetical protein LSTR_LSTR011817 [Laodelphax striatellus]|uniref:Uncharacterized protein n=1 Tax=Laodelphax striatellus TaxID=195883 RepID=A0A482XTF5_LAOST|nr:hypothetical protein LSTR_LSTR011817 [Laodelphax striatellus]